MHFLFSAGLLTALVAAAVAAPAAAETAGASYQVAQSDVGFFIDRHGRRVYFDRRTNRIIAVEEPQPLRNLLERVLPPLGASPPGPDASAFPPAPEPAPRPESLPSAETVPPLETVVRAPLGSSSETGESEARDLNELLGELGPDTQNSLAPPGDPAGQVPAPEIGNAPAAEDQPGTRTAALPRPEPVIPAKGPAIAKLQVLLDRHGYSPGVIDGRMGSNVAKAINVARNETGISLDPADEAALNAELDRTGGPAFADYTITPEDAAGPFAASIPEDYAEKAALPALSYTSPMEMLAERFHMSEAYLVSLNPDVNFYQPGTVIRVVAVGRNVGRAVARVEADKAAEQVRAYDQSGRLVAAYPATIGSSDTPSPSGTVQVERVAFDPNYTYNPKINFVQGSNNSVLTIPPGPNGPVGSIWIALSKPTYGIHGTPEPDRIGKTNSHGCVRLTNWDAAELARLVAKGVTVEFID
ncbi:MAG: L,D-transpeptidase [Oricola sp.]